MYIDNGIKSEFNIRNVVNEAYVGKSDTLLKLEKAIGNLRKIITPTTPNNCKELLEINRLIEKQFGMKIFSLIMDSTSYPDAYTYTLGRAYDYAMNQPYKYVTGDKSSGYRFTYDNQFAILTHISYGILSDKMYTDAEIVAILLHEIGHNFGDCIYDELYIYNMNLVMAWRKMYVTRCIFATIIAIVTAGAFTPLALKSYVDLYSFENGNKTRTQIAQSNRKKPQRVQRFLQSIFAKYNDKAIMNRSVSYRRNKNYLDAVNNTYNKYTDADRKQVRKDPERQSEVFADKFAGVYGYSVELSTALAKMSLASNGKNYKAARRAAKGDKYYQQLNDDIEEAMFKFGSLNCHPELTQRINSEIDLLRKEYEKANLDPKIKKELMNQLKQLEDLVKDLTDAQTKMYHIDKAQALYNKKINDQLPSAVDQEIEDKIDEALDKALEAGEKANK